MPTRNVVLRPYYIIHNIDGFLDLLRIIIKANK